MLVDYNNEKYGGATITVCKGLAYKDKMNGILILKRSIQDTVETWNRNLVGIVIMGLSMLLIGTLILGFYLRHRVVKPLNRVVDEADRFAREI